MKLPVQAIAHNAIQFSVYILYKICSIYFTGPKFTDKKVHAKIIIITGLHNAHPKKMNTLNKFKNKLVMYRQFRE